MDYFCISGSHKRKSAPPTMQTGAPAECDVDDDEPTAPELFEIRETSQGDGDRKDMDANDGPEQALFEEEIAIVLAPVSALQEVVAGPLVVEEEEVVAGPAVENIPIDPEEPMQHVGAVGRDEVVDNNPESMEVAFGGKGGR